MADNTGMDPEPGASAAGAPEAPGGFAPPPLYLERLNRLRTAVALGTPDRVPLSLVMDAFAARTMGVKLSDFVSDVDVSAQTVLSTMERLGDVDSIQMAPYLPAVLGILWLAPVRLPGRELPEDSLWQLDEQVRIQPEDYDRIIEGGWGPWFGEYVGKYLQEAAAAGMTLQQEGPRWVGEFMKRGYVVFSPATIDHPFEHLCGGRSVKEFMLDLYHMPDKVQAVMEAIMAEKRVQARELVRAVGPYGYWVGGWRTAPEFLSPRLWDRFVWPYMKELIELVVEEGGIPVLHYDANWDREVERLKDLPEAKCLLQLDGKTDIFRAKKILAGHMCILGDVPPALLTLGTVDEVKTYCRRLLDEVGPDGFIMGMGCAIPPDAKFENVKAMVDSVKEV
ncbi:MAG: uroporphyrinogen-III decarboxylase [Actinomycetia bacterium]|nr:uroporphyrinogen-III decarboxylase [Actinomycetes bacterium]